MRIDQSTHIEDPTFPTNIANKRYVDDVVADIVSVGTAAPVFITNVTNAGSGIVGGKVYLPNTIPSNAIITEATSDDDSIAISVLAEGGSLYSPTLTIAGEPPLPIGQENSTIILSQDQYDKRTFVGTINITVNETTVITVRSDTGASTQVTIVRAAAGPTTSTLMIGPYPNQQTATRSGQIMSFTCVVENAAVNVDVINSGAAVAKSGAQVSISANDTSGIGFKTVSGTFVVSSKVGTQKLSVQARNALGTVGNLVDSVNTITLDQVVPTITGLKITYPGVQEAIKGTEVAVLKFTLAGSEYSTVTTSGLVDVVGDNSPFAQTVNIQGIGSGDQVDGTNVTILATKLSNGSMATSTALVKVLNSSHTNSISIVGNPTRLISSPSGQQYTVYIESNSDVIGDAPGQQLYSPSFNASIGLLSAISRVTDRRWKATLTIIDSMNKGAGEFIDITTTNIAGLQSVGASNTEYTVGGFTERTLTIPLYDSTPGMEIIGRTANIGTTVGDVNKLSVSLSGTQLTFTPTIDDASSKFTIVDTHQGFTIPYTQIAQYAANGSIFYLNDKNQAGANTTGTATITIKEEA